MDDLNAQLSQILSDPNSMAQIQSIMGSLGMGGQNSPAPTAPVPAPNQTPAAPMASPPGGLGALGGLGGLLPQGGGDMMAAMAKLAPFLSTARQDDDATRLLHALKPMLSEARTKKIDEAMRVLQILKLLPLLKDAGILSSLLGGLF